MNTPSPADVESLLRNLSPEPLAVNRDELFFRAGYAAGAKTKGARLFWPSAAAALLVVCMALGIAIQRQNIALQTALAQNPLPPGEGRVRAQEIVDNNNKAAPGSEKEKTSPPESIAQHPHPGPLPRGEGGFSDDRLRSWQQLATANFRQHGHLTARGWVESPDDAREPPDSTDESPAPRPRPSTYLELRQLHLEG